MAIVEAESVCKAAKEILLAYLNANIATITAEWAAPQNIGSLTLVADPLLEFKPVVATDIHIGRSDVVDTFSNFPSIQLFIEDERPDGEWGGEQQWSPMRVSLVVRVIVQGITVEHTEKLLYRYKDAVLRTLMQHRTLSGAVEDMKPPLTLYTVSPEDPLYKAAQMTFESGIILAWGT